MITIGRLAPKDQWDQHMLDQLFGNELYPTGLEFDRVEGYPHTNGCVLVIPGRYWHTHTTQINEAIGRYDWVLGMRVGDEEDLFDIKLVEHPNIKWWVQTPRADRDYGDARFIGVGYPPHTRVGGEKSLDVFMSAQDTHIRRHKCFAALELVEGRIERTSGFTQGLPPDEYSDLMGSAKVAPAPSGAFCPDSFRFWEALEAGAIPIADDVSPVYNSTGFWQKLCPGAPFPIVQDYADLPGYIKDCLETYPKVANRVQVWWAQYKRQMALNLVTDLGALGAL